MYLRIKNIILPLLLILLLILIRTLFFYYPQRIHGDDIITAFFSSKYNLIEDNLFDPVPKNIGDWVCQFPSIFFVIQKIFFLIFGESLLSIKLSVLPYIFLIFIFLFLIIKLFFNFETAIIGIILYSFFSPSLYIETLGLHFLASNAVYLGFLYYLFLFNKKPNFKNSFLLGFYTALCYLFYSSSYFAFFILLLMFIFKFLIEKKAFLLKYYFFTLFFLAIFLFPFFFNMYKKNNFYIFQRINQVSLINGMWSDIKFNNNVKNASILKSIINNFYISVLSLYKDNIGGHGGYWFGYLALFDKFNIFLIFLGFFVSIFLIVKKYKHKIELIIIWISILFSFIFGMVLTIPPPAFHRFYISFPLLIIIISSSFYILDKFLFKKNVKLFLIVLILFIYLSRNILYFKNFINNELIHPYLRLSDFINQNYEQRNIYIAAFPSFALEKVFYFSLDNKKFKNIIKTDYHENLLNSFNSKEKYIYIITFPENFLEKFRQKDKYGKMIKFNNEFYLFFN